MAQSTTINFLIGQAQKEVDMAAIRLGAAIRSAEELSGKLNLLKKYREDYSLRLQNDMQAGREMQHLRNFQQFLAKIDEAIRGQQRLVDDAKIRIDDEKLNWQEQERKRLSYSALQDRAVQAALKKEAKRDQLQSDEHGSRQAHYKRD